MTQTMRTTMWRTMPLLVAALVALMSLSLSAARPAHASAVYTVNLSSNEADANPGDGLCDVNSGTAGNQCTLRAAIEQANATAGADTINFKLPKGKTTIRPDGGRPPVDEQTAIDGYSQPGARPNTLVNGDNAVIKVKLDGINAGPTSGLYLRGASNSVIRGLTINRFADDGISIDGGQGVRIEGNFIGTNPSGTKDLGNGGSGVHVGNSGSSSRGELHVIGGSAPASRNIISGNERSGVEILLGNSNKVLGNYIGTDRDGTDSLTTDDMGNTHGGVLIWHQSNSNIIGGVTAGTGNVISNNGSYGVQISDYASKNKVLGNRIGTDGTGKKDLGNELSGVGIIGVAKNVVGNGSSRGANTIAFNGGGGVQIQEAGVGGNANGNRILRNRIFSNADLGILLGPESNTPIPNDSGDADTGANTLQNYPVLSSAKTSSTKTTIKGKLSSQPNATFRVQFFSNPKDTNEGKKFIGQMKVTTDTSGNVSFKRALAKVAVGQAITATATGPGGNTSEFSTPRKVVKL